MEALRWDETSVLRDRGLLPSEIGDRFQVTDGAADRGDRYRGALVGLGMGNALGRSVEGQAPADIARRHGRVDGYLTSPNGRWLLPAGQLGDQAQTAIIAAATLGIDGRIDPGELANRLAAWLPVARAPGAATRQAVSALRNGTPWITASVASTGSDAMVRAVPVGLASPVDGDAQRRDAALSSVVTHRDPTSVAAAVVVAAVVAHLVDAAILDIPRLDSIIRQALAPVSDPQIPQGSGRGSLGDRIVAALSLVGSDSETALPAIGTSDDALEALPAALWALASFPGDPVKAISAVIHAGGAAGTTGALTGAFSGALNGLAGLPAPWVDHLEYVDGLSGYADVLLVVSGTGAPKASAVVRDPLHPATHSPFRLGGLAYPTLEHAIRSTAAADPTAAARLRVLPTPADTRRYAATAEVRADWPMVAPGTVGAVLRRRFDEGSVDLDGLRRRSDNDLERLVDVFGAEPFDYPVLLALLREEITELLTA